MWLSHTGEESPDTRQEVRAGGPAPRVGLCKGQRACPRVQAGEPDAAGPRPRRPAERTRPRKDHAESRTVRQWTASGTRQDSTGDQPAWRVRDIETQSLSYIGLRQTERAGTQRTTIVLHSSQRRAIDRQPRAPTGSTTLARGSMAQTA